MKIIGWKIQAYTNEFKALGWVKDEVAVEFGNSPIRDKLRREEYIQKLIKDGRVFSVLPITK